LDASSSAGHRQAPSGASSSAGQRLDPNIVNAVPANRQDAAAVPVWWPLEPDDPQCKCKEIDQLSLMLRLGYEDAGTLFSGREYHGNLVAMRCRFEARRPGGCTNGADCDFCHVHPWGKDEVDYSGIVLDPTWGKPDKTRKLHRHERRERREQQGDENAQRREYWARLIRGVTEDARLNIHFWQTRGASGAAPLGRVVRPQAPRGSEAHGAIP
jgi:hypothetical protein